MNQRTLDRINEDEISRRIHNSLYFRMTFGFMTIATLWAVGGLIGGRVCADVFLISGCVLAVAFIYPIIREVA